jgi:hypothetical protein
MISRPSGSRKPTTKGPRAILSALTLPALKALAAEEGTDLGAATKKADIIAAIEAARAAKAAGGDGNQ